MPLPTSDLIDWLTDLGWDTTQESGAPIVKGPYILKSPDRLVTITPMPGPGYMLEGASDAGAFQARVRGSQDNPDDAEDLAYALDSLILGAQFPADSTSGKTIIHVHRQGGTPSPLASGPDDGDRTEFVCPYLVFAST